MFTEKKFNITNLIGISEDTINEHIKLYAGYVKHANLIMEKKSTLSYDTDSYMIAELTRRFAFEFDGMRNHEYYFEQLEGGYAAMSEETELYKKIVSTWGSFDNWLNDFKQIALTRGIGWVFLYQDTITGTLMNTWIGEQHDSHLTWLQPIVCLDMWEHSYMLDVKPSEKKKYVEAYMQNINYKVCEKRYK